MSSALVSTAEAFVATTDDFGGTPGAVAGARDPQALTITPTIIAGSFTGRDAITQRANART